MDGIHDLGGMHGFGPIPIEDGEYVFRHDWQRRSFGLAQALAGTTPFCADMHRYKIEQLAPIDYLQMDYFEKWAIATSELVKDAGLATAEEIASGRKQFDVDLAKHVPSTPEGLLDAMKNGVDMHYPSSTIKPGFSAGQAVRVSTNSPAGHTRIPCYVRSKTGTIVADNGVFQFADAVAAGAGPQPQHCYTVLFSARDLWGTGVKNGHDKIYLDLAEAYLDHV